MKLYKREGSPFWWTTQPKRMSTKRVNKAEAMEVAVRLLSQSLDERQLGVKPKVTLLAAMDRYIETQGNTTDHRNLVTRRNKLFGQGKNLHTGELWANSWHLPLDFPLESLSSDTVSKLTAARKREGLSNSSVNLEIKLVQRVWNLSRKTWGYFINPDVQFDTLKTKAKSRYLSQHEEKEVLTGLQPIDKLLALILLDTGLRSRSEAMELRWKDVDLKGNELRVFRRKTQASDIMSITSRLREALVAEQTRLEDAGLVPYQRRVIPTDRALKRLRMRINSVCNDPDNVDPRGKATIHSLRDTFATRLITTGLPLYTVSKLLGHSSLSITQKYAHVELRGAGQNAAKLLDNLRRD